MILFRSRFDPVLFGKKSLLIPYLYELNYIGILIIYVNISLLPETILVASVFQGCKRTYFHLTTLGSLNCHYELCSF